MCDDSVNIEVKPPVEMFKNVVGYFNDFAADQGNIVKFDGIDWAIRCLNSAWIRYADSRRAASCRRR